MKFSRKPSVTILVSLAILIGIAGVSYAWFAGVLNFDDTAKGNAARIKLMTPHPALQQKFVFASALPGEEIKVNAPFVWYDGNRDAIIRISLGATTGHLGDEWYPGQETSNPGLPGPWDFSGEYEKDGVKYKYTKERLKEILDLRLDDSDDWFVRWHYGKRTNSYYIWVKGDGTDSHKNLLDTFVLKFTGEFGGLFVEKDAAGNDLPGATPSVSRQWEQESIFRAIGLKAEVIQVTEEAILDHWGNDSLLDVVDMKTFPQFSLLEDWTYLGE